MIVLKLGMPVCGQVTGAAKALGCGDMNLTLSSSLSDLVVALPAFFLGILAPKQFEHRKGSKSATDYRWVIIIILIAIIINIHILSIVPITLVHKYSLVCNV